MVTRTHHSLYPDYSGGRAAGSCQPRRIATNRSPKQRTAPAIAAAEAGTCSILPTTNSRADQGRDRVKLGPQHGGNFHHDWAISFEKRVRELLLAVDHKPLIEYEARLGSEAELAVPTPDHYLPLLYIAGTRASSEPVTFPVEGVDGGSVSMLAVRIA